MLQCICCVASSPPLWHLWQKEQTSNSHQVPTYHFGTAFFCHACVCAPPPMYHHFHAAALPLHLCVAAFTTRPQPMPNKPSAALCTASLLQALYNLEDSEKERKGGRRIENSVVEGGTCFLCWHRTRKPVEKGGEKAGRRKAVSSCIYSVAEIDIYFLLSHGCWSKL